VLSAATPLSVDLTWWLIPGTSPTTVRMTQAAHGRGLYAASIGLQPGTSLLIEYFVQATLQNGNTLTAPVEGAETVVVLGSV
jgi:hypothetical protein